MFRRIAPVWVATPTKSFDMLTLEGVGSVVADRDFVCWRSEVDVWPQPRISLLQAYDPVEEFREIKITDLPDPLLFQKYKPKANVLIKVRAPRSNEESLTLQTGDVQRIDPELDCVAQRVDGNGIALGGEYVLKRSILAESCEPVTELLDQKIQIDVIRLDATAQV
ncbi:hypothetical protein HDU83_003683 [Entophlyctis luteolus]|nr:hypothetical protein HDU83_003683 [Entophlyctis luteolus]KAJ3379420.1 hypothetical protein HDU84_006689 [Entophlyctis sp. JEL0112]